MMSGAVLKSKEVSYESGQQMVHSLEASQFHPKRSRPESMTLSRIKEGQVPLVLAWAERELSCTPIGAAQLDPLKRRQTSANL